MTTCIEKMASAENTEVADQLESAPRRSFLGKSIGTGLAIGAGGLLQACGGSDSPPAAPVVPFAPSAVYNWNQILLQTISDLKPGPPMTARAIGIVNTAMYDAWAAYTPRSFGSVLGAALRRPVEEHTQANKEKAIAIAAYRLLVDLYPAKKAVFDAQMSKLALDVNNTTTDISSPIGVGNVVARALMDLRHNDGANQLGNLAEGAYSDYTGYVAVNTPDVVTDPSQWQQLRFANGATPGYIGAHWGKVLPFALSSSSQFRPPAPPVYGGPSHRAEAQGVVDALANLTEEQKVIAEYWADGPASVLPPGHWMIFAQVVALRDQNSLDKDVKMFFMVGNAVMDAGIATWEAKRFYNYSRPITAIRDLFAGQQVASFAGPNLGVKITDGKDWMPYQSVNFITPPFAEYTSGHSAFSAAGAEILKRFTGSDTFNHTVDIPANWSTFEDNLPKAALKLSWKTFSEAADQAGISRIYGGIHFESGDLEGRKLGRKVAEAVWNKCQQLFQD